MAHTTETKLSAKYFPADKEANMRAGWSITNHSEPENSFARHLFSDGHGRALLSRTATDAQIRAEAEFDLGHGNFELIVERA